MEEISSFASGLADKFMEERDTLFNNMIVDCCCEISRRLENAIDKGVVGADFSDLAQKLVNAAAESLSMCDGDVLNVIYERLSDASPYCGAVNVDAENQVIEFVGEEDPLNAVVG